MIALAPHRTARASPGYGAPAVGTSALRDVLAAPAHSWRVVGTTSHGWWCVAGDTVVVVCDEAVTRLPNAVMVPSAGLQEADVGHGALVTIGDGTLQAGGSEFQVVRWWDSQVRPVEIDAARVANNVGDFMPDVIEGPELDFWAALTRHDPSGLQRAACALLGRGAGLTPDGDDFLTGAVAGSLHIGASTQQARMIAFFADVRLDIQAAALASTTALSYSLLRLAFTGHVVAPLGALLRAITGRGRIERALADTSSIGHTSGASLARGALVGAAGALGMIQ